MSKVIELKINDSELAGWDGVALVEMPAIEENFMAFGKQEFESYSDYPEAAVAAAKQGIKRNEELGNPCATQVGKVRAQQLANGEALTLDTIQRMRSFLIRQKDNYELAKSRNDYDACGYISYLLWGGEAALPWAEKKLRQAGYEFELEDACWPGYEAIGVKELDGRTVPNCVPKEDMTTEELFELFLALEFNESCDECSRNNNNIEPTLSHNEFAQELREKMRVIGPVMTPDKLIPRVTDDGEEYQVFFSAETIEKIAYKAMKENKIHKVNIEHDKNTPVEDAFMVETWLVEDDKKDKSLLYGFEPVKGQWFAIYQLGKDTWNDYVKTGLVKGYSIEGYFIEKLINK